MSVMLKSLQFHVGKLVPVDAQRILSFQNLARLLLGYTGNYATNRAPRVHFFLGRDTMQQKSVEQQYVRLVRFLTYKTE